MMQRALWMASLVALAALAQDDTDPPAGQTSEPSGPSQFDNNCLMCVAKGNLFCVSPAQQTAGKGEGSCLEATCAEQSEGVTNTGTCTLVDNACAITSTSKTTFGQCGVPDCTHELEITAALLQAGGVDVSEADEPELIVSASQKVDVPAMSACSVTVKLADDVADAQKGGWVLSQWMDSLDVHMTRVDGAAATEAGQTLEQQYVDRSGLYSKETFSYTRQSADDVDLAGRVPFSKDQQYTLIITNNDAENVKSLYVEYGAASLQFALSSALLAVSFITATLY